MAFNLKSLNVGLFCPLFLIWILWDVVRKRIGRSYTDDDDIDNQFLQREKPSSSLFTKVTALLNFLICFSHLAACLHEFWTFGSGTIEVVSSTTVWFFACMVVVYSLPKRWPLVLIMWWVFSTTCDSASVTFYLLHRLKFMKVPDFIPKASVVDFATLPLSLVLSFNVLHINCTPTVEGRDENTKSLLGDRCDGVLGNYNNLFSRAGIWSHLTFGWLNPLFEKGHSEKLQPEDIPSISQSDSADEAYSLLEESLSQTAFLSKAILNMIMRPLVVNGVWAGVNTLASYVGPLLITSFVNLLTSDDENTKWHQGIILSLIFFAAKIIESLSQRQWYFGANRIGIRVRAALMVSIYKKSLSIKYGGTSSGKITNYLNVDVERIGDFCLSFHNIWLLPVQVIFALIILCKNIGTAPSFAALAITIFVMVSNIPLANKQKKLHSKIMEAKDSRVKATSETLKSMRVLKLHSWELMFMEKVLRLRETESSWLKKYLYTSSAMAFLFWASPTLVSVVTFGVCIALGTPLTTGTVLSALATFRIMQDPIYNLPELISTTTQTKVSLDRIQNFIWEQEDQTRLVHSHTPSKSGSAIKIKSSEFAWQSTKTERPTIKIIEKLIITKGSKVAVCGSVGSGKTSFLCSVLGEIPRVSGPSIKTFGSKAFVPQSAWIQTGTIRDNILFGKEMNRALYEKVVEACALNQYIKMWSDGDLCIVGERGLNLSGGQKQRIQMARALYSNSDIYLLDDPFSAVDAHTGAHMFKKCLMQLLHEKTVVYVTHQLEFLDASDLVLVMKGGKIIEVGKYRDLISNPNGELTRQMEGHNKSLNQVGTPKIYHQASSADRIEVIEEENSVGSSRGNQAPEQSPVEEMETGRVKWHVYGTFITAAYRGALVPIILLCQILFQLLQMASNYWIAWGSEEGNRVTNMHLIEMFALLSGGSSFFILGRAVLLSTVAIETAQRLFNGMITSVFRAPLSFFDTMPSSRILNRSSTDQSRVDTDVPYRLAGLAFALIQLLSVVVLMCHVAWQMFFLFLIVFSISIWYLAYYISTARELARMVPTQQAPILHHFSESISGASIIRSFCQEDRFWKMSVNLVDEYSRVTFHNTGTMEWLCIRINFLFNFVFFILLIILVSLPRSAIDPSLAGLAATYGLNLNVLQAWVIWNFCNVDNKMISVERILQFTGIPSEAPLLIEDSRPHPEWPLTGRVDIENLKVKYNPALPTVLKGITCTFPGQNKIGVVGRTGSGKSTLIQALFRVVEPYEGRILIDGIDISKIGLQDLRFRLSIIPQDPILFQGTLRMNLDPLEQHSDNEIWEVLHKCHLAENVKKYERLLDEPVAEEGENLSMGQRQLVCLARVLLQKRRILVLDEATASLDTMTDNLIQETIRQETKGCTIITVAHRIPTVGDNDLVLVLGEGKVVEYDSPARLLEDSNSAFSSLVTEFWRRSSTPKYKDKQLRMKASTEYG